MVTRIWKLCLLFNFVAGNFTIVVLYLYDYVLAFWKHISSNWSHLYCWATCQLSLKEEWGLIKTVMRNVRLHFCADKIIFTAPSKPVVKLTFLIKILHHLYDELSWSARGKTEEKNPGVKLVKKEFVTYFIFLLASLSLP